MKKAFAALLITVSMLGTYGVTVFLFAHSNVIAAESKAKLYLTPPTQSVAVGSTTTLQIRFAKNTTSTVNYVNADMTFPVANLEVVSISKQGSYFTSSGGPTTNYDNTTGVISVKGKGANLPTTADVLVATATVRAKKAGSVSVSFTANSQVGEMNNGGHVKDILDAKSGATLSIFTPLVPPTTTSNDPLDDSSVAGDPAADSTDGLGPVSDSTDSGDVTDPAASSGEQSNGDGTATASTASDQKPSGSKTSSGKAANSAWQQYLWPIVGSTGLLAAAGVGGGLFALRKRRAAGKLPTMNEPETLDGTPPAEASETVQDQSVPDEPLAVEEPEIFTEAVEAEVTPAVAEPAIPIESAPVVAAEVETIPSQEPAVEASVAPDDQRTAVYVPERPAVTAQIPQLPPSAPAGQTVRNTVDYANLPDMFELGEQRLQNEGLSDMKPTNHSS